MYMLKRYIARFIKFLIWQTLQLRDEIKAAHDDADQARAERDKVTKESTVRQISVVVFRTSVWVCVHLFSCSRALLF